MPKKSNAGRPTKMTEATVNKLEEAFAFGCSDIEACLFAGISKQCLYNYQHKNPEFIDRKEMLKKTPVMIARKTVVDDLETNPDMALKYLERKNKKEFSLRTENLNAEVTKDDLKEMEDEQLDAELEKLER